MGNYDVLTRRQRAVLDYLRENEDRFVDAPTLDELCDAMGLSSRRSMHKHVMALIDAGFVEAMDRSSAVSACVNLTKASVNGTCLY